MLILKFRKYNNSLYKLSSDFQIVTVLGLQFIIFILQQLHNLITTALLAAYVSNQSQLCLSVQVNRVFKRDSIEASIFIFRTIFALSTLSNSLSCCTKIVLLWEVLLDGELGLNKPKQTTLLQYLQTWLI